MPGLEKAGGPAVGRYSLALVSATTITLYVLNRIFFSSHPPSSRAVERKAHPGTFWLTVELTFKTTEDIMAFEQAWRPLASYCRQHEHGTYSYQMARSETEPLRVMIWERYRTRSDYLDVHKKSQPFLEFRAKLTALDPVIKGHGWLESDMGYV